MLSLVEVAERVRKGPRISDMDWNMGLFQKMNELAQRFDIVAPENSWDHYCNKDPALSERALEAGMAFVVESGTYCIQTGRVVSECQVNFPMQW